MKAVILAAGEGSRLRPFTLNRPKVMLPIFNKPIMEYVLNALAVNNVRDVGIVVGYKRERVMNYFGEKYKSIKITYIPQERQIGTAHALYQARDFAKGEKKILVLPGDNYIDEHIISDILSAGGDGISVTESNIPSKYGVVREDKGRIKKIIEKPVEKGMDVIFTGIGIFSTNIFKHIEYMADRGKHDFTEAINHSIEKGEKILSIRTKGKWVDAVYPWDLLTLNQIVLTSSQGTTSESSKIERAVIIKGKVSLGNGCIIKSGSYIEGPVCLGDGSTVGPHAYLSATTIGRNVNIGSFTHLNASIVMDNVSIGTGSILSHSIVGEGSVISPNFVANAEKGDIVMDDDIYHLNPIGAIVGENCHIGAGVVIDSGKFVGCNVIIKSMKHIQRNISDNSFVE